MLVCAWANVPAAIMTAKIRVFLIFMSLVLCFPFYGCKNTLFCSTIQEIGIQTQSKSKQFFHFLLVEEDDSLSFGGISISLRRFQESLQIHSAYCLSRAIRGNNTLRREKQRVVSAISTRQLCRVNTLKGKIQQVVSQRGLQIQR